MILSRYDETNNHKSVGFRQGPSITAQQGRVKLSKIFAEVSRKRGPFR
jgi:hypothetical protein